MSHIVTAFLPAPRGATEGWCSSIFLCIKSASVSSCVNVCVRQCCFNEKKDIFSRTEESLRKTEMPQKSVVTDYFWDFRVIFVFC